MRSTLSLLALSVVVATAACEHKSPVAYGGANSLIVVAPEHLWHAVEDTVRTALEPTIQTVRRERTFDVTYVAPTDSDWVRLRVFKQVILIGYEGDGWLRPAVRSLGQPPDTLPAILTTQNVWAEGQAVTVVLLPRGAGAEAVARVVPELHQLLDRSYKEYVRQRMYLSGRDEALRKELGRKYGFALLLPDLYEHEAHDSTHIFRNHYAIGSKELRRAILVTWRTGTRLPDSAQLVAWRDSVGHHAYDFVQEVAPGGQTVRRQPANGLTVHGAWQTPEGAFPAGGPFIARAVPCPAENRTYLIDAWLYAPAESKYEYILQLENILDSFECRSAAQATGE